MTELKILFFAGLRELTGTKELILHFVQEQVTLHELVIRLLSEYESLKSILFHNIPPPQIDDYLSNETDFHLTSVKFARNRKIISNATKDVIFSNGDTIALFLPLIGG